VILKKLVMVKLFEQRPSYASYSKTFKTSIKTKNIILFNF
jgi:hypothetical protein